MDDPAIWVNSADPANSRVLGTHKKAGLYVYNLAGEQLEFFADGRLNNIDVRSNGLTGGFDLAIATKRDDNSLLVYGIDAQGAVRKLTQLPTNLSAIYGVCIALFDDQQHIFVNDKDGRLQHYLLGYRIRSQREQSAGNFAPRGEANSLSAKPIKPVYDQWNLTLAREFKLASQPEGCAVDDQRRVIFIGEENRGIWVGDARPDKDTRLQLIAEVGDTLHADVEGMAVAQRPGDASPVLVVSSQGNDSYIVYEAVPPFGYLGGFRIGIDGAQGVDGSSETDGLDVTSANLGPQFPAGLLVVQDGRNLMPSEGQNFKLVDWRTVVDILGL
jgi:3-phytase